MHAIEFHEQETRYILSRKILHELNFSVHQWSDWYGTQNVTKWMRITSDEFNISHVLYSLQKDLELLADIDNEDDLEEFETDGNDFESEPINRLDVSIKKNIYLRKIGN